MELPIWLPRLTDMRIAAVLLTVALLTGCAQRTEPGPAGAIKLADVTGDPQAFDGEEVRLEAGYYGAFETSVLTSGFAESFPPQPREPTVWVTGALEGPCVQRAETVTWAERVVATGTFRYDPGGGFGHLGAYEMTLEGASLACA